MKLIFALLSFSLVALATDNDVTHRPKSFNYDGAKAVFVDMEEANYDIAYDVDAKSATVSAQIRLNVVEEGFPLFDLIQEPTSVKLDGLDVTTAAIKTPNSETTLRVLNKKLPIGAYMLEIKVPLTTLVEYTDGGVKNAFWVTDLEDRYYLERYIPVNLEYDVVKMSFNVSFKGLKGKQHIFANGSVTWTGDSKVKIDFPDYFTMNSLYFHTTPVGSVELLEYSLQSKDGRQLPVAIYMAKSGTAAGTLDRFKTKINSVVSELEGDYGSFPHAGIIVYNASLAHMGLGGMEYAGATVTDLRSVSHELFHSYFARGLSPANGNAGWIDESLASWRDNGYNRSSSFSGTSSMASNSYYTRKTDTAAYSFGARFMAYLDGKFGQRGGLKPFMNKLLEKRIFLPLFTEDFIGDMEEFYGEKLGDLFKAHVYNGRTNNKALESEKHPIHRKMGAKELQQIL